MIMQALNGEISKQQQTIEAQVTKTILLHQQLSDAEHLIAQL